jgi:hypothetical protein
MPNEPLALAIEPEASSEDDYQAFCATLSQSARGRAFLAEHARRQQAADTGMLLTAIGRLEAQIAGHAAPAQPSAESVGQELSGLLDAIRDVRIEIDVGNLTMRVAKLVSLIDVVHQRIEAIVAPAGDDAVAAEEPAGPIDEMAVLLDKTAVPAMPDPPAEVADNDAAPADETVEQSEAAFALAMPDAEAMAAEAEAVPDSATPSDAPSELVQDDAAMAHEPVLQVMAETPAETTCAPVEAMPPAEPSAEAAHAHLAAVTAVDEPAEPARNDLMVEPTPEPGSPSPVPAQPPEIAEPPAMALAARAAAIPDVSWFDSPLPASAADETVAAQPAVRNSAAALAITAVVEAAAMPAPAADEPADTPAFTVIKAGAMPPPAPFAGEDFSFASSTVKTIPLPDPLAPIMALSEEERIALFT